jgi:hypothetical protein
VKALSLRGSRSLALEWASLDLILALLLPDLGTLSKAFTSLSLSFLICKMGESITEVQKARTGWVLREQPACERGDCWA